MLMRDYKACFYLKKMLGVYRVSSVTISILNCIGTGLSSIANVMT